MGVTMRPSQDFSRPPAIPANMPPDQRAILHARTLIAYLLADTSIPTKRAQIAPSQMPTETLGEIWRELERLELAAIPRDIFAIARRLRLRGVDASRDIRSINEIDALGFPGHWAWCAGEIRLHAAGNKKSPPKRGSAGLVREQPRKKERRR
jgi:hypothetical protein